MDWLLLAAIVLVLVFGFVVLFGAPYLPTMQAQTDAAFDLLQLKKGQHLLELGCGDGRVLIAAARRGLKVTGYELNPILVGLSWLRTLRYRGQIRVIWGNFWAKKLPEADGIFTFLLPKYMARLDKKIVHELERWRNESAELSQKPVNPASGNGSRVKLVSFAFSIPGKNIDAEKAGVYLYRYR